MVDSYDNINFRAIRDISIILILGISAILTIAYG